MPTIPEIKQQALVVIDLCADALEPLADQGFIFLRTLHKWIESHPAFVPERPPLPERRLPMTDEEARAFKREPVPFGMYSRQKIGDVNDWQYLEFLADSRFVDQLRRYLASPAVKRERGE